MSSHSRAISIARATAAYLALQVLWALLNARGLTIGRVFERVLETAEYFRGGAPPRVPTFPMWGYSLLLTVIPSQAVTLGMQMILAPWAMAWLYEELKSRFHTSRRLLLTLFCFAIPWYVLHAESYPSSFAASAALLGILVLKDSTGHTQWRKAIGAGLLIGIAQISAANTWGCSPSIAIAFLLARMIGNRRALDARNLAIACVVALAAQGPWAIYYRAHTGRWGITESSGGAALYGSLGDLPGNPWGVVRSDGFSAEMMRRLGYSPESAFSEEGNQVLGTLFRKSVREHPGAYLAKLGVDTLKVAVGGFGYWSVGVFPSDEEELDVAKEHIKSWIRLNPNSEQIADYRARDIWDRPMRPIVVMELAWLLLMTAAGSAVLLGALAGVFLSLLRLRAGNEEPLTFLLGAMVLYRCLVEVGISHMPRYMNDVYLCCLPFFVFTVDKLMSFVRRSAVKAAPDQEKLHSAMS